MTSDARQIRGSTLPQLLHVRIASDTQTFNLWIGPNDIPSGIDHGTESTECDDCNYTLELFQHFIATKKNKRKKQSPICGPHWLLTKSFFSVIFNHVSMFMFCSFSYWWEQDSLPNYGCNKCKQFWSHDTGIFCFGFVFSEQKRSCFFFASGFVPSSKLNIKLTDYTANHIRTFKRTHLTLENDY